MTTAVRGAQPVESPIQFVDLGAQQRRLAGGPERAIGRVLAHRQFVDGPEIAELEERLAGYCGARHVVTCASGTDALLLTLRAWGVGAGDAVFVPAFTFAASAAAVVLAGATPVFVDVTPDTFTIDANGLADACAVAVAAGLRPAAVMPVDLFGHPADYDALGATAREVGLKVLADAAQSFGATYQGRRVGALADATATSFFPSKPLGCYGDGGAVCTDDDEVATTLRSLRSHGQGEHKYDHVRVGTTARLDTIQAAVLLEKLSIFDEELDLRAQVAAAYTAGLEPAGVPTPTTAAGVSPTWAQYTIQTDQRDRVVARLAASGVPTAVHYPLPVSHQPAYSTFPRPAAGVPVSAELAQRVVSLPMHPYLDRSSQQHICHAVQRAVARGG